MTNVNVGKLLLDIIDFIASVGNKVYEFLTYELNIPSLGIHCSVFQLIGVIGVGVLVLVLILKIIL